MLLGTPLSTQFTKTSKGEPALYVSIKADENGHTHSTIVSLGSDKAKEYAFKVLHYLGYDSASDPDMLKLLDDCAVDKSKTIEFELKEDVGTDGKTYKNLVFPKLDLNTFGPKNVLSKEEAKMIIIAADLKSYFSQLNNKFDLVKPKTDVPF